MADGFPELEPRERSNVRYARRGKEALPPMQLRKRDVFWMALAGYGVGTAIMWAITLAIVVMARLANTL